MNIQRILVAVDSEPIAAHAAELGLDLATSLGAGIAFVHAIDPGLLQATGITPHELAAEAAREGRRLIAGFCQRMPNPHEVIEFIHTGKPAAGILRSAREWPADMIVIGSHGRHGVGRALLGSVAEAVMREAPCPVLVVRAKTGG